MYKSTWQLKVRFGETDAAGIVYYPNIYKWMDQATQELFSSIGFSSRELLKNKLGVPLVETHCEFKSPIYFDDIVTVVTKVTEIKNKVFRLDHEIYRQDTLLAKGYEVRVWVNIAEGKLKAEPIPDDLRDALSSDNANNQ